LAFGFWLLAFGFWLLAFAMKHHNFVSIQQLWCPQMWGGLKKPSHLMDSLYTETDVIPCLSDGK
jgi:hypothetical protein